MLIVILLISIATVVAIALTGGFNKETTPTPTVTPEVTPTPTPNIQAVHFNIVLEEMGYHYYQAFTGFVQNIGTSPGLCYKVDVWVYDEADVMLEHTEDLLLLYLLPGERFPFAPWPIFTPGSSWARYELTVDTTPWNLEWYRQYELNPEIQVTSSQWEGEDITGVVVNGGQESAHVVVEVVGYDSVGEIIAHGDDSVGELSPRMSSYFRINSW